MGAMQKPKIVIYVRAISGGAGKNAVKYANILAEHGHDVILTCGHAPSLKQYIPDPSVQLEVFGTKRNLSAVAPLRRILAQLNPDGSYNDYACDMAALTAEVVDKVLPATVRPSGSLVRGFVPDCDNTAAAPS